MQLKTIKQTIIKKLEDWLSTINNDSLRKDIRDNLLVSGGSIANMFLKEPVNDYDIYIKDMNVLKRLAEYYTDPFRNEMFIMDGRNKKESIAEYYGNDFPEEILEDKSGLFASAMRNMTEDRIRIFFLRKDSGFRVSDEWKASEANKDKKYLPSFYSANAISLTDDIQIVLRFHGDSEKIHSTFDFVHPTNYFTFEEGLVTNKEALTCLLTKQLKYQGSFYPLTSIIRVRKFLKRGWNINAGELLKIMFQISELDLKNPDVLEEQLIGVDVAYFSTLVNILRGKGDKDFNYAYLSAIIDKVFSDDENETEE